MILDSTRRPPEVFTDPAQHGRLREVPPAARRSVMQTTHLSAGVPLVPPSLMVPPFTNERRGIMHDQAAALLNRHLRRLARMRNPVELRIARLLGRMKRLSSYLDLGFARMTDYAVERLGLSARRAQVLLQIDDGLRPLPATAHDYETGRISHSQVLLLLRIATPATESVWLEKAATMNVRKLEKAVRRARVDLEQERAGGPPRDAASGPAAPATAEASPAPAIAGSLITSSTPAPAATATTIDASPLTENDQPWVQVSFPAPGWVRGQWEWAVEVFRRTAGAAAPIWQAAEGFAAEHLSGLPQLPPEVGVLTDDAGAGAPDDAAGGTNNATGRAAEIAGLPAAAPGCPDATSGSPEPADDDRGLELFEEVQRALDDELGISNWAPSADDMDVTLPRDLASPDPEEETPGDAASLDHRLRGLIDIRQNLAWHQGRLLRTFANYRLYRALGFESFSRYCRENLGMSVRRARRLIALERRLIELVDLERAYREGELSWVKASEIARVAQPETEQAWIDLGRSVTARRIREEVALALADMENDALPWGSRRGAPRGLTPDGRVQLSAPSLQRPTDPGCTPAPDPMSTAAPDSAPTSGVRVQTSARSNMITTRIHFRAPEDVAQLWRQTLAACRTVNGDHLQDWECVAQMLDSFRRTWDLRGSAAWRRRYRIFERDGWRCRVPGCTSRRNLHGHHVVFRSLGGSREDDNIVTVCATHHLRCLHSGSLRCYPLPDGLLAWEFGARTGGPASVGSVPGDSRIDGGAHGRASIDGTSQDATPANGSSPVVIPTEGASPDAGPMSDAPADMNLPDPARRRRTSTCTTAPRRFVEDVVWEAARDAVRLRDDSLEDCQEGSRRPSDRRTSDLQPAPQPSRSEAPHLATNDSVETPRAPTPTRPKSRPPVKVDPTRSTPPPYNGLHHGSQC